MKRIQCLKAELDQLIDESARIELAFGSKWVPAEITERCTQLRRDIRSMELEEERINKIRHLGENILTDAGLQEGKDGWQLAGMKDSEDEILVITMETSGSGAVVRFYCTYANLDECHNWHKKELFIISTDWMLNTDSEIEMLRVINADAPEGMKYFRLAQFNATIDRIKTALKGKSIPERSAIDRKMIVS